MKAAFHLSPFLIHMLLYSLHISIFEKNLAPLSLSIRVEIRGSVLHLARVGMNVDSGASLGFLMNTQDES